MGLQNKMTTALQGAAAVLRGTHKGAILAAFILPGGLIALSIYLFIKASLKPAPKPEANDN